MLRCPFRPTALSSPSILACLLAAALLAAVLPACRAAEPPEAPQGPPGGEPPEPSREPPDREPPAAIPDQYLATDVDHLIQIRDTAQLKEKRKALTRLVFGTDTVPAEIVPGEVKPGHYGLDLFGFKSAGSVDALEYVMEHGIDSSMYYFHALHPADRLAIYHHGHGGGFKLGKPVVAALLDRGYDVILLSMPLRGWNSQPVIDVDHIGLVHFTTHRWLMFLDRPLGFYMAPIAAAVNHGLRTRDYESVVMVGFSGGAWSTVVYAAMDERVSRSYPVAGTKPTYLRSDVPGGPEEQHIRGTDPEQLYPPLLKTANYLEMYVMGSAGEGRRQVQIINLLDTEGFGGLGYTTYEKIVAGRVKSMGGEFRVFLDTTSTRHSLSAATLEFIMGDIESSP